MSTGLIVAIIVVALILVALLGFIVPRMRAAAGERARQRELERRREQAATESRQVADVRHERAEVAERKARIAEQEAARERAEARLHEERAAMHEQGLADDELVGDGGAVRGEEGRGVGGRETGAELPARERIVEPNRDGEPTADPARREPPARG